MKRFKTLNGIKTRVNKGESLGDTFTFYLEGKKYNMMLVSYGNEEENGNTSTYFANCDDFDSYYYGNYDFRIKITYSWKKVKDGHYTVDKALDTELFFF